MYCMGAAGSTAKLFGGSRAAKEVRRCANSLEAMPGMSSLASSSCTTQAVTGVD